MKKTKTSKTDHQARLEDLDGGRTSSAPSIEPNDRQFLINNSYTQSIEFEEQVEEVTDEVPGSKFKRYCCTLMKFGFVTASVLKIKLFLNY